MPEDLPPAPPVTLTQGQLQDIIAGAVAGALRETQLQEGGGAGAGAAAAGNLQPCVLGRDTVAGGKEKKRVRSAGSVT